MGRKELVAVHMIDAITIFGWFSFYIFLLIFNSICMFICILIHICLSVFRGNTGSSKQASGTGRKELVAVNRALRAGGWASRQQNGQAGKWSEVEFCSC